MTYSRRQLFGFLGGAAKSAASAAGFERASRESPTATEELEAAFEILAPAGPEYGSDGLSNHGPMAADALVALNRPENIRRWVESYRRRLGDRPYLKKPIDPARWREALGAYGRVSDWAVFFRGALAERPWNEVLAEWCGRLAPSAPSAGFHGLLRTAHAARSLSRKETPARTRELAEGLAYWAARHRSLPLSPSSPDGHWSPAEALAQLPTPAEPARAGISISDRIDAVVADPSFARAASMADTSGRPASFLSDVTETFAISARSRVTAENAIALVHSITGPSAVRLLLPFLDEGAARDLARYAWQGAAAISAGFAGASPETPPEREPISRETLVDRALATGDEHAIKLAEACLRENEASPRPAFLAAAGEVVRILGRRG